MMSDEQLIRRALEAQRKAYAPYSHFSVGAALLCADGAVYTGSNIENASYPCGICAERVAAATAIHEGHRDFAYLAIVGASDDFCTPCGLCRQFLYEFNPDLILLCANQTGNVQQHILSHLLSHGFGALQTPCE